MIDDSAVPAAPEAPRQGFLPTVLGALTLQESAYRAAAEDEHPIRNGLIFLVMIGVVVAVAGVIGAGITWWISPDLASLRDAIWQGLQGMPWREQFSGSELQQMDAQMQETFDQVWQIVSGFTPGIGQAAAGVVFTPLAFIVGWFVYGLLAHGFARLLGGHASLPQTYGALSLAYAPNLLNAVQVVPMVQTAGLAMWSTVCTYVALKTVHGISPGRAFWATLLPFLLVVFVAVGLGLAIGLVAAAALAQFFGGMA